MSEPKPLTFLIVDDDIPLSLFFKNTLLQNDHKVFVAVNEHGAREILKSETIDILLCDYMLPGLDGAQIIKMVKQHYEGIYCVLISGYQQEAFSDLYALDNADLIIGKPIFKETLDSIIQQYLLQHPEN